MKTPSEKAKISALTLIELLVVLAVLAVAHRATAQSSQFFRISGPAATTITMFNSDGTMVWSNALAGTNYTVQTAASLSGGTNWVDYVKLSTTTAINTNQLIEFNSPVGMVFIPAGVFTMGDVLDGEADARPTNVMVSAFYMDVNLVSYSQWQSVYNWATNNGYTIHSGSGKAANHPVQAVDWYDCVKWCNARSQQEGLTPVYYKDKAFTQVYTNGEINITNENVNWSANGYRLPTEAEWEKAARGGLSGQRFPWGNTISESQANYQSYWSSGIPILTYDMNIYSGYNTNFDSGALPYTSPVGSFSPNGYGLYDMAGNVYEWCWDWYGITYAGGADPRGPDIGFLYRVLRGGPWQYSANFARCAYRNVDYYNPNAIINLIGFRSVRGL